MTQTQRKAMEQALKALEWGCNDLLQGRNAADALRAALAEQPAEQDGLPLVVAGAIFDFAGYMTTRSKVIEVGSTAEAGPVADLVKDWAKLRGLSLDDAAVLSWQEWLPTAPQPAIPPGYKLVPESKLKQLTLWAASIRGRLDRPEFFDNGRLPEGFPSDLIFEAGLRAIFIENSIRDINAAPEAIQPANRGPLTRDQVKDLMKPDYDTASMQERADFMTGFRAAERAHNIGETE